MTDFFISYTNADTRWAEWIAWTLEDEGYSVILQKWDFGPGSNFILEMQRAAAAAERTVAVLSPDYLKSAFTGPEWAAAFATDPSAVAQKLVPVRVRLCEPGGLLGPLVHIDIVELDEGEARGALLAGLRPGRAKPDTRPPFPSDRRKGQKPFPGPGSPTTMKIRRQPTELDKRRFVRDAFATISDHFQSNLAALKRDNTGVETDFDATSRSEIRAEVYVDGALRANCRVWIGGLLGDNGISFAEGSTARTENASNETLTLRDSDDLTLDALMNMGIGKTPAHIDPRKMSPADASEYLWARFLWRLT